MVQKCLLIIILLFISFLTFKSETVFAQQANSSQKTRIEGKLLTSTGHHIPYASVAIYDTTKTHIITGTTSDSSGSFSITLDPGTYIIKISFLSFKPFQRKVELKSGQTRKLGTITMKPSILSHQGVVVRGKRSQMQLGFAKRVFQVGSDITSIGGSVLDVLNNVPSVTTDVNGTISLRGSSAVRILINGKPSSLYKNGSLALQSLSADMIKEIQVITNPSAKYSAEGSAGIINIILKKKQRHGFHGNIAGMARQPKGYQLSGNLNYRRRNINWFFNGSVAYNADPTHKRSYQRYSSPDTSYIYYAVNDGKETDYHGNYRLGADIHLPEQQTLTPSATIYFEDKKDVWHGTYSDSTINGVFLQQTNRHNVIGGGEFDNVDALDYTNLFGSDNHKLTANASYEYHKERELPHIRETYPHSPGDTLFDNINNTQITHNLRIRADYVVPVADSGKFEAGIRSTHEWLNKIYITKERQHGTWAILPDFNNNFTYFENVNAAYSTLSSSFGHFEFQAGLRAEQTNLHIKLKKNGNRNHQSYLNLFPSIFLTWKFNDNQSIQISYSRRISRPDARLLLPYTDYSSSRSRFSGNPDLKPEYSNSFETEFLQYWDTGSLLSSVYYRHRTGVIDEISTLDNKGITRSTPFNLADADAWGLEFTFSQDMNKNISLSSSLNLYRSKSNGQFQSIAYQSSTNRITGRIGMHWQITSNLRYQAFLRYIGPEKTIQGHRSASAYINTAIAKDLFDGNATISLNIQDLLDSRKDEYTVNNPNYFLRQKYWEVRLIRLNFTYRINEKKQQNNDD